MRYSIVAMIADGRPDITNTAINIEDVILPTYEIPVVLDKQLPPKGNAILTKDDKNKFVIAHILMDSTINVKGRFPHLGGDICGTGKEDEAVICMSVGFSPRILSLDKKPNPDKRIGCIE